MATKMNIYQKLVEIRKEVDRLTKDTEGYKYTYVSGSQVLGKIRPKMDELGVILEPRMLNQNHNTITYKDSKGKEVTDFLVWGEMEMRWINAESPEDFISIQWQLMGQQNEISKAFGSGLTYSERYFMLKYFNIPTDEDDPDKKQENKAYSSKSKSNSKLSEKQVKRLFAIASSRGVTTEQVKKAVLKDYNKVNVEDLTKVEYDKLCNRLEKVGA